MQRRAALTLVALPLLLAGGSAILPQDATGQQSFPTPIPVKCDSIKSEPLVMVDTSGYGLAGPLHFRFTVFNNGIVSMSRMSLSPDNSKADFIVIPEEGVKKFVDEMTKANAFSLCDQDMLVADVPPTTVTVFRGRMDAKAHTFTFWAAFGKHAQVAQVIQDFQNTWFPGF